ncbi:MAG: thioesterase family protein [Verrucomicrobiota bacterium]
MREEPPPLFVHRHRVQFAETDMAGLMHFSNFFRLMESCEHAWFRSRGLSIHEADAGRGEIGWPRVHASAEYKAPLRFEDEVDIELRIAEKRAKTLRYAFTFRVPDGEAVIAKGEIVAACVTLDRGTGKLASIEIPHATLEQLGIL